MAMLPAARRPASGSPPKEAEPASAAASTAHRAGRRWRSSELFGAQQEIEIEHGEAIYRLRLTSLGKLILTK